MFDLSRRRLLRAAGAIPVTSGLLALSSGNPARAQKAQIGGGIWDQGAKPGFVLSVAEHEIAPFGAPMQALLAGGTWPGMPIRYRRGDQFRSWSRTISKRRPACIGMA